MRRGFTDTYKGVREQRERERERDRQTDRQTASERQINTEAKKDIYFPNSNLLYCLPQPHKQIKFFVLKEI